MKDAFDEVIGYENVKRRLRMISDMLKHPEEYRRFNGLMKGGILFEGVSGVGKTTMARCLIASSGRKYFTCRKKGTVKEFPALIRKTFEEAEKAAPSIVFLDDIDKFVPEDSHNRDADAFVTVQSCMDDLNGKDVFVVATAQKFYKLPVSLRRHGRLGEIIYLTPAEGDDWIQIVNHYLSKTGLTDQIDPVLLANLLDGATCSKIKYIVERAGMKAAYNHQNKISMDDLIEAYVDGIIGFNGCEIPPDPKEVIRGAYHESAHAVVSEVLRPGSIVLMTVKPSGMNYLGFTKKKMNHGRQETFSDYEWNIKTSLAGKAARELFLGSPDLGVGSDIENIYLKLDYLVDTVCAYGFQNHVFTKDFKANGKNKAGLINVLISYYYMEVKQILVAHRKQVEAMADRLAEKGTLLYPEIREIMKENRSLIP